MTKRSIQRVTTVPVLRDYLPQDNSAALALEARCEQGSKFSLSFWRPYFHRRAEGFAEWRMLTAWKGDELVAIGGGAIKPVNWSGKQVNALYLFDFRVDPGERRSGIARTLALALEEWAQPRAEIGYAYAVGDNEAIAKMAERWLGAASSPACAYLAYPTYKAETQPGGIEAAAPLENHARYVERMGDFGLYGNPTEAFCSDALIGSWRCSRSGEAGCSVWSNADILSEVVAGLPLSLRIAGSVLGSPLLKRFALPHVPRIGERLRSWYLFDFHADNFESARQLIDSIAVRARFAGIDYCYIIHSRRQQDMIAQLRRSFPAAFAPIIPFSVLAKTLARAPLPIDTPYIDIRDM